jgi:hypothetical protein
MKRFWWGMLELARLARRGQAKACPTLWVVLLCAMPAVAAVTGTVINRTTGQPQAGITVSLLRMGQAGPEPAGDVKADAQGKFSLDQPVQGPTLLRATIDGVTYNKVLAPGQPTEGITLDIYNASKLPGDAKVSKHMFLFQPQGQEMVVNEAYIIVNGGKAAWNDPAGGTIHFYLPQGASKVEVNATPPAGMPLKAPPQKTDQSDVYKINFAIRPGETRLDMSYSVPYTEGATYTGKIVSGDENTYLIVPNGITIKGDHLSDLGPEPRTQAHIFGLQGTDYSVQFAGTLAPANETAAADADSASGQPQVQQIMPRIYGKLNLILPLALGILALGFVLLYRAPAKETHERGRG